METVSLFRIEYRLYRVEWLLYAPNSIAILYVIISSGILAVKFPFWILKYGLFVCRIFQLVFSSSQRIAAVFTGKTILDAASTAPCREHIALGIPWM